MDEKKPCTHVSVEGVDCVICGLEKGLSKMLDEMKVLRKSYENLQREYGALLKDHHRIIDEKIAENERQAKDIQRLQLEIVKRNERHLNDQNEVRRLKNVLRAIGEAYEGEGTDIQVARKMARMANDALNDEV